MLYTTRPSELFKITASKITAFLEHIYKPISMRFCESGINEYCRDSEQYLQNLVEWKNISSYDSKSDTLYMVAGDFKALYSSVKRSLVRNALQFALTGFSDFHPTAITNLIELTMLCLNNVVIQHKNKIFKQTESIITGDNHSVSLANITLHYIIWPIAQFLQQTIIFKRFVDDIIWISLGEKRTNSIKEKLTSTFQEGGLELIFREISTHEPAGSCVEFLDVNHRINDCVLGGFVTTDYIKPTARGHVFLNPCLAA